MPILKNAKKALRSSKRKAGFNQPIKARLKTTLKKLIGSRSVSDLNQVYAAADKAVKKNVIHKNKANRLKRQAAKLLVAKTNDKPVAKTSDKPVAKKTAVVKKTTKPAKAQAKFKSTAKKKK